MSLDNYAIGGGELKATFLIDVEMVSKISSGGGSACISSPRDAFDYILKEAIAAAFDDDRDAALNTLEALQCITIIGERAQSGGGPA